MTSYDEWRLASPNEDRLEDLFPQTDDTKIYDMCGVDIVGKSYPIVDENFNPVGQQCEDCYIIQLGE